MKRCIKCKGEMTKIPSVFGVLKGWKCTGKCKKHMFYTKEDK